MAKRSTHTITSTAETD